MHVPGEPIPSPRAAVLQMLASGNPWLALPAKRELRARAVRQSCSREAVRCRAELDTAFPFPFPFHSSNGSETAHSSVRPAWLTSHLAAANCCKHKSSTLLALGSAAPHAQPLEL
ncbi:hypothetical protein B5807_11410 [Epicoccum nigrum]|uniref:Uncharacterized protein n=1 Tax=Epicoccum nigrum TaxID=105696 RepID=A0A1Y2LKE0_EPING|nr:hypothetical protein B5807_11410 [Epicoccum nigrum]